MKVYKKVHYDNYKEDGLQFRHNCRAKKLLGKLMCAIFNCIKYLLKMLLVFWIMYKQIDLIREHILVFVMFGLNVPDSR